MNGGFLDDSIFYSAEQEKRIYEEQAILRSGQAADVSLCQYKNVSCVRCCLPHIGGDEHMEDSPAQRRELFAKDRNAYCRRYAHRYLGPGNLVLKFRNFNPRKDPRIEASQYEDSLPDVGQEEMERRFASRRALFLAMYEPKQPRQSLLQYMKAAQEREGYAYTHAASAGPASMYFSGSATGKNREQGSLPECQLLGCIDESGRVGCMAHPLSEISHGYDGRDLAGFFHHSGCCDSVGCEASKEFPFLSASARKVFDKTVEGLSWYAFSRHATSVFVYYLRSYDFILQKLDDRGLLEQMTTPQLAAFTNAFYDAWPLKNRDPLLQGTGNPESAMSSLQLLSTEMPLAERILYLALNTEFSLKSLDGQLRQARTQVERSLDVLSAPIRANDEKKEP